MFLAQLNYFMEKHSVEYLNKALFNPFASNKRMDDDDSSAEQAENKMVTK